MTGALAAGAESLYWCGATYEATLGGDTCRYSGNVTTWVQATLMAELAAWCYGGDDGCVGMVRVGLPTSRRTPL